MRKRFSVPGDWKLPYYLPSIICSTPVGATLVDQPCLEEYMQARMMPL